MKFLIAILIAASCSLFSGCGNTAANAKNTAAAILTSPANQAILTIAGNAAAASVISALGSKTGATAAQQQAETVAASSIANSVSSDVIYAAAGALRTQEDNSSPNVAAAVASAGVGAPIIAPVVSGASAALTTAGMPSDLANEAIATSLDSVALALSQAGK